MAIAYVGRTWIAAGTAAVVLALAIWGVGFALIRGTVNGPAYGAAIVLAAVISAALLFGNRACLSRTAEGLHLVAPFGRRTVRWADIAEVDVILGGQWVRCRDSEGRISLVLASSAWHPRTSGRVRRDNVNLAASLQTGITAF
ncbi:PH domain-containing protein [Nocardioides sp. NPDC023903]|uniref:PH domain-containing protein n=1 Tax=Nocardioides sp. NPDC023903 TaxID=3157195 RepID=UPI003408B4D0